MWRVPLFRWTVILDVVFVLVFSYIGPTMMKAVGEQWSVRTIAGMSLAGTILSLFQAPIAKWVSPRVILYGGCLLGLVSSASIFITASVGIAFALFAVRIAWVASGVISQNWDALQWEALAEYGEQARMRTMLGSICSGAALLGSGAAFIWPPGLAITIYVWGSIEALGVALSWRVAGEVLKVLDQKKPPRNEIEGGF